MRCFMSATARRKILDAAWTVAREQGGVAALTMREVADRVGIRCTLAVFALRLQTRHLRRDVRRILAGTSRRQPGGRATEVATGGPSGHTRLLPPPTWPAIAVTALDEGIQQMAARGIRVDAADIDLYTAVIAGLVNQQWANDPGGSRWGVCSSGPSTCMRTTSDCSGRTHDMTSTTTTDRPRRSVLDRATALRLAETEYGRYLDQLRALGPDDWTRPTDCPARDVQAMATHSLGMAEMAGSLPEMVRQFSAANRRDEEGVDALTVHQVETRRALTPPEIIERYAAGGPRAVRGRRRRSALVGRMTMPDKEAVNGVEERWSAGFVFETILTRDTWMHRIDTAEATGRPPALHRRPRRGPGGRRGYGVGRAARCALHPPPHRAGRRHMVGRDRGPETGDGRRPVRPDCVWASSRYWADGV